MGDSEIIICEAGDYSDLDNTGIVVLQDDRRIAVFHREDDAHHWAKCVAACTDIPNPAAMADVVEALRDLVLTKQIHEKIWSKNMSVSKRERDIHELDKHKKRAFINAEKALAKLEAQS